MPKQFTSRDREFLAAIHALERDLGGHQPTVREIGALLQVDSTSTVQMHLDKLAEFGLISRRGRSRILTQAGLNEVTA